MGGWTRCPPLAVLNVIEGRCTNRQTVWYYSSPVTLRWWTWQRRQDVNSRVFCPVAATQTSRTVLVTSSTPAYHQHDRHPDDLSASYRAHTETSRPSSSKVCITAPLHQHWPLNSLWPMEVRLEPCIRCVSGSLQELKGPSWGTAMRPFSRLLCWTLGYILTSQTSLQSWLHVIMRRRITSNTSEAFFRGRKLPLQ